MTEAVPKPADPEAAQARRTLQDQLSESEERLRLATAHAEVGFWDVDEVGKRLHWPPLVKAMFGISADAHVSMDDFYGGLHPDDRDRVSAAYARAADPSMRSLYDVEYRTVGKEDGIVRWVAAKGRGIFDGSGAGARCIRVIGVAIDITRRKQDEVRLRESETLAQSRADEIEAIYSAAPVGLCVLDRELRYLRVNECLARMQGRSIDEYAGKTILELTPNSGAHAIQAMRRVLRGETLYGFEVQDATRSTPGAVRWWRENWVPLRAAGGQIIGAVVSVEDVTEIKAAEYSLRSQNETLKSRVDLALAEKKLLADIVEGTDAFVQVADLQYRWLAINDSAKNEFERIFGVRPAVGKSMLESLAHMPDHQADVRAVWGRALGGEEFTQVSEFGDSDRDRRFYEMKFNALRDETGAQIGAYQFVYDVTDRIVEQKKLALAEEQLRHSQKMDAMGQLTGGVAHDFNNLLTPIMSALDLLSANTRNGLREQRLISMALTSAERAKTLVHRLLAFARRQPIQPIPVDVRNLVRGMAELIGSTMGPQIKIVVDVEENLPPALADPNQIEMALLNLSVNARDAMPDGGTVRISATTGQIPSNHSSGLEPGKYLRLSVADDGRGMDAVTLARAVEPFFSTKPLG